VISHVPNEPSSPTIKIIQAERGEHEALQHQAVDVWRDG
jgi:hypothetical protein